jgi:hypothetical protein
LALKVFILMASHLCRLYPEGIKPHVKT